MSESMDKYKRQAATLRDFLCDFGLILSEVDSLRAISELLKCEVEFMQDKLNESKKLEVKNEQ